MTTLGVVIVTQGSNGAPSKGKVTKIPVTKAAGLRAEVKGTGGPYAVEEGPVEMGIPPVEFPHMENVVVKQIGCPVGENTCSFVRRGRRTIGTVDYRDGRGDTAYLWQNPPT